MPRQGRLKPSTNLISKEIVRDIKLCRPLHLFISKRRNKGNVANPLTLRARFARLSEEKRIRYLQKSVHNYIQLLDENDIDEHVQVECQLFNYLLMKSERKKYFESINAPEKLPGKMMPYYNQTEKEDSNNHDNSDTGWRSLSSIEKKRYRKLKEQAKAEYSAKVRNFAEDLPERLKIDYLLFAEQAPSNHQVNHNPLTNGHNDDDNTHSAPIRQRRKSLAALPESLQTTPPPTTTDDHGQKLTNIQIKEIHRRMPSVLYYENEVPDDEKPTFTRLTAKNTYIRSVFNGLDEKKRIEFMLKSIQKWNEFLADNPLIITNRIPTLHLLLPKNEDICLYFSSLGLPERPPFNTYFYYNHAKEEIGSQESWTDLSQTQKSSFSHRLEELKNEYYEKLVEFVDYVLPTDYMRYEFFRNIKYAVKDYESATKSQISEKNTGEFELTKYYIRKMAVNSDINHFNQIKQKLLSTTLTDEQKDLVEQLNQLLSKLLQEKHSTDHQDSNSDKSITMPNTCTVTLAEETNDEMNMIDDSSMLDSSQASDTSLTTEVVLSRQKRHATSSVSSASQPVKRKRMTKKKKK